MYSRDYLDDYDPSSAYTDAFSVFDKTMNHELPMKTIENYHKINKIRIYLKDLKEPLELVCSGTNEIGPWIIMIDFKADKTVHVKRKWEKTSQVLYTFPLNNLHYIDWGNCNNE